MAIMDDEKRKLRNGLSPVISPVKPEEMPDINANAPIGGMRLPNTPRVSTPALSTTPPALAPIAATNARGVPLRENLGGAQAEPGARITGYIPDSRSNPTPNMVRVQAPPGGFPQAASIPDTNTGNPLREGIARPAVVSPPVAGANSRLPAGVFEQNIDGVRSFSNIDPATGQRDARASVFDPAGPGRGLSVMGYKTDREKKEELASTATTAGISNVNADSKEKLARAGLAEAQSSPEYIAAKGKDKAPGFSLRSGNPDTSGNLSGIIKYGDMEEEIPADEMTGFNTDLSAGYSIMVQRAKELGLPPPNYDDPEVYQTIVTNARNRWKSGAYKKQDPKG